MYQAKEPVDKFQKFQQSKEQGMAIMASNRDATMIVCEIIRQMDWKKAVGESGIKEVEDSIRNKIKEWRKWFYVEIYDTTPDEQLKQEAKEATNSTPF